jgi:predicted DNA-binding transcriptional regulator AlpA
MGAMFKDIVDVETLAEFFGVDRRTINNWINRDGAPKPSEIGEYKPAEFIKWRLNFLQNRIIVLESGSEKKYEAELKGQILNNIQKELKIKRELKELVPLRIVKDAYVSDAIAFRNSLGALQNKLYLDLEATEEQREKIKDAIDDVRNQVGNELRLNDKDDAEDYNDEIEEEANQQIKEE